MALPQISRHIRAVGGHGASKEGSWEHRHVLSVTQQERSRLLCPLRLRLFPYHRPTPPCSRATPHPLCPKPAVFCLGFTCLQCPAPGWHRAHGALLSWEVLGADPAGEERELRPLCALPCLTLGVAQC